jgi:hypothetical protein
MCKDADELLTPCPMCADTEVVPSSVATLCIHPDCANPPFDRGPQCQEHGCRRCGGIILADTEDWERPACADCFFELGRPTKEPNWS